MCFAIKMPPTVFPVNSVKAMRICVALDGHAKLEPFARAAFAGIAVAVFTGLGLVWWAATASGFVAEALARALP